MGVVDVDVTVVSEPGTAAAQPIAFPAELLLAILEHIPETQDARRSATIACRGVCRAWSEWLLGPLFSSLKLTLEKKHPQGECTFVSPSRALGNTSCSCIPSFLTNNAHVSTCVRTLILRDAGTLLSFVRRIFTSRARYRCSSGIRGLLQILRCLPNLEDLELYNFLPCIGLREGIDIDVPRLSLKTLTVHLPGNIWNDDGDVDLSLVVTNILSAFDTVDTFTCSVGWPYDDWIIYSYPAAFIPPSRPLFPTSVRAIRLNCAPQDLVCALQDHLVPGSLQSLEMGEMESNTLCDANNLLKAHVGLVHFTSPVVWPFREQGAPDEQHFDLAHCEALRSLEFASNTTSLMPLVHTGALSFFSNSLASLPAPCALEKVAFSARTTTENSMPSPDILRSSYQALEDALVRLVEEGSLIEVKFALARSHPVWAVVPQLMPRLTKKKVLVLSDVGR